MAKNQEKNPEVAQEPKTEEQGRSAAPQSESQEDRFELSVLASRHRVPSWQQAALLRLMGWADGKMVTDADYQAALAGLHGRRMGGGRLA